MDRLQQLQQLTALRSGAGSGILKSILMMWMIWPVLCGLIGAGRGKAMSGFMQGLFWGPFGLLPVLLSAKKYPCPTCGCQTLKVPLPDRGPRFVIPGPQKEGKTSPMMESIPLEPPAMTNVAVPGLTTDVPINVARPMSRFVIPTPAELEAQQLHQWVNSEPAAAGAN